MNSFNRVRSWKPVVAALVLASGCMADTVYVNRGIPNSGVNAGTDGATSSVVDWINQGAGGSSFVSGTSFLNGDSFVLPTLGGGEYSIDSISTFVVLNNAADTCGASSCTSEFQNETLYEGQTQDANGACGTPNTCGNLSALSPSSVTFTQDTTVANGCEGYLAANGGCLPIYEVTFAFSPGLLLQGNTTYDFAANGQLANGLTCTGPNSSDLCGWYSLASNASGYTLGQPLGGATGTFLNWDATDLNGGGYFSYNSAPGCAGAAADVCGGWYQSSNIDVIVAGNVVPEPGTIGFVGFGGLALIGAAIRRRRARS